MVKDSEEPPSRGSVERGNEWVWWWVMVATLVHVVTATIRDSLEILALIG